MRRGAFGGLIGIAEHAAAAGDRVLATRCARRTARQLFTSVEPMGLKHRQCAVVERSVRERDKPGFATLRRAVAQNAAVNLTAEERQRLSECYYSAIGASPDDYLFEFYRRLEEIMHNVDPSRVSAAASQA
jgi:hypothetical protein